MASRVQENNHRLFRMERQGGVTGEEPLEPVSLRSSSLLNYFPFLVWKFLYKNQRAVELFWKASAFFTTQINVP